MKKMTLRLDELVVDSFETHPGLDARAGTVKAHDDAAAPASPRTWDPSCNVCITNSCYMTCQETCQTFGCGCITQSCFMTCQETCQTGGCGCVTAGYSCDPACVEAAAD